MNQELNTLLNANESSRDLAWEAQFLQAFPQARLRVINPEPQSGPDGFAYLLAKTEDDGPTSATELMQWLSTRGIGLVLNPQKQPYPDYVFKYGTLWNFVTRGQFFEKPAESASQNPEMQTYQLVDGQQLLTGNPSEGFLPPFVRHILKQFFMDQGVLRPQFSMLSEDGGKSYDLVFSWESLGKPPEKEHQGILEAISWFLPDHYALGLISEKVVSNFYDI